MHSLSRCSPVPVLSCSPLSTHSPGLLPTASPCSVSVCVFHTWFSVSASAPRGRLLGSESSFNFTEQNKPSPPAGAHRGLAGLEMDVSISSLLTFSSEGLNLCCYHSRRGSWWLCLRGHMDRVWIGSTSRQEHSSRSSLGLGQHPGPLGRLCGAVCRRRGAGPEDCDSGPEPPAGKAPAGSLSPDKL